MSLCLTSHLQLGHEEVPRIIVSSEKKISAICLRCVIFNSVICSNIAYGYCTCSHKVHRLASLTIYARLLMRTKLLKISVVCCLLWLRQPCSPTRPHMTLTYVVYIRYDIPLANGHLGSREYIQDNFKYTKLSVLISYITCPCKSHAYALWQVFKLSILPLHFSVYAF